MRRSKCGEVCTFGYCNLRLLFLTIERTSLRSTPSSTVLVRTMAVLKARYVVLVLLTPTRAIQSQCSSGGSSDCPCITSYNIEGLISNGEELVVNVDGTARSYDPGWGLHSCKSHDSSTAPYCNAAGFPSWCSHSWCFVNASACALSASPSLYAPGLHYSYETCDAADTFTSFYTHRDGVINLCSVSSAHSALTEAADGHQRRACGSTDTVAQVSGG